MSFENRPQPQESYQLADGEHKVMYERVQNAPNAGSFVIAKEDHTLGNVLTKAILRDRNVLFAGYRIPHPLTPTLVIKVRTKDTSDPIKVTQDGIRNLKFELESLTKKFQDEVNNMMSNQQHDPTYLDDDAITY